MAAHFALTIPGDINPNDRKWLVPLIRIGTVGKYRTCLYF